MRFREIAMDQTETCEMQKLLIRMHLCPLLPNAGQFRWEFSISRNCDWANQEKNIHLFIHFGPFFFSINVLQHIFVSWTKWHFAEMRLSCSCISTWWCRYRHINKYPFLDAQHVFHFVATRSIFLHLPKLIILFDTCTFCRLAICCVNVLGKYICYGKIYE